jgi:hypothetical protein
MEKTEMHRRDLEEFLELNKVERGIHNALDAGAIIFTVAADLSTRKDGGEVSDLFASFGVVILSTSRRRNLKLLEEIPNSHTPLCTARYIGLNNTLDVRPRNRFADDPALVEYVEWATATALAADPDLNAFVAEWNGETK